MVEASVIVLTFNSMPHIASCLDCLRSQTCRQFEVIVVDNASSDGTPDFVAEHYPEMLLLRSHQNGGYAAGCNLGFRSAQGEVLAVIGPDCEPEPAWLEELVLACRKPGAGLATSMVRRHDQRDLINTCGNEIHLLGLGFCHGLDEPGDWHLKPACVASISGCAFAIHRQVLNHVGAFDEAFFMYCEDTDLSVRTWLAGYRVVYVPDSVAYHRYQPEIRPAKFHWLERNRHLVLLKNLRWRSLAALMPGLVAGELMMWAYAAAHGPAFCAAKLRAWQWILGHRPELRERRRAIAATRRREDSELLMLLSPSLPHQLIGSGPTAGILAGMIRIYFSAVLRIAKMVASFGQSQPLHQCSEPVVEPTNGPIKIEHHDAQK